MSTQVQFSEEIPTFAPVATGAENRPKVHQTMFSIGALCVVEVPDALPSGKVEALVAEMRNSIELLARQFSSQCKFLAEEALGQPVKISTSGGGVTGISGVRAPSLFWGERAHVKVEFGRVSLCEAPNITN